MGVAAAGTVAAISASGKGGGSGPCSAHPLQARRLHHKFGPALLWQHASRVQGGWELKTQN